MDSRVFQNQQISRKKVCRRGFSDNNANVLDFRSADFWREEISHEPVADSCEMSELEFIAGLKLEVSYLYLSYSNHEPVKIAGICARICLRARMYGDPPIEECARAVGIIAMEGGREPVSGAIATLTEIINTRFQTVTQAAWSDNAQNGEEK